MGLGSPHRFQVISIEASHCLVCLGENICHCREVQSSRRKSPMRLVELGTLNKLGRYSHLSVEFTRMVLFQCHR